jgi:hypothetical protein
MYEILDARIVPTDFSGGVILPFFATDVPVKSNWTVKIGRIYLFN